jgi:hypothetical protein
MDIIVYAYESEERAMGWYYYLDDKASFPFSAECVAADKRSPLELGERVSATKMSGDDICSHEMYVDVTWSGKVLTIPLAKINPLGAGDDTIEAVGDWHYWVKRGYTF